MMDFGLLLLLGTFHSSYPTENNAKLGMKKIGKARWRRYMDERERERERERENER